MANTKKISLLLNGIMIVLGLTMIVQGFRYGLGHVPFDKGTVSIISVGYGIFVVTTGLRAIIQEKDK